MSTRRLARPLHAALLLVGLAGPAPAAEITVGLASAPSSADPFFHEVGPNNALASLLFDFLVRADATRNLHPSLATAWTRPDDRTWRFELRRDVTFQDGTPFTALDVLYSLCRPLHAIGSTASFSSLPKDLAAAEAIDEHTLLLTTRAPRPSMLMDLASFAIISAHSAGVDHVSFDAATACGEASVPPSAAFDGGAMANGTGRYRLETYQPGEVAVLRANPHYFGDRPHWDRVTLRPVPNTGARVAGLLAGDFDLIENPAAQDLPRIRQHGGLAWTATPSDRIMFLQPDIGRAKSPLVVTADGRNPLQDVRVRRAISLAIDRRAIAERMMDGLAVPADQYSVPGLFGALTDAAPLGYDPAQARKLLAEAGYPDGFALTLSATNDRYINDARVAQALGQYLSRVGIRASVDAMPQTVFFPGRPKRLFSLSLGGWGSADASTILRLFIAGADPALGIGGSNYGGYRNVGFDEILRAALTEMDDARRGAALRDATRIALADLALIPLYWETTVWAYKDRYSYAGRVDQYTDVDGLSIKQ